MAAPQVRPALSPGRTSPDRCQDRPTRIIDGRYAIDQVIGEGAMGTVYQCRHLRLRCRLAMKILRPQFACDADLTKRFLNEASAASAIDSINVIQMRDCGTLGDGRPYLVMDLLDGEPLSARLQREPLMDRREVLGILRQLCLGLQAAHTAGVIHRDLKPENIHLCPSQSQGVLVKLLDFGVAKILDAAGSVTRSGRLFGTPQYMSPEQCRGLAVDARSDIYAAGVLLYEMLTGRLPFDGETELEILTMQRYQPLTPPRQIRGMHDRITAKTEQVLLRCLAKDREERWSSAAELLQHLDVTEWDPQLPKQKLKRPQSRSLRSRGGGAILPLGKL